LRVTLWRRVINNFRRMAHTKHLGPVNSPWRAGRQRALAARRRRLKLLGRGSAARGFNPEGRGRHSTGRGQLPRSRTGFCSRSRRRWTFRIRAGGQILNAIASKIHAWRRAQLVTRVAFQTLGGRRSGALTRHGSPLVTPRVEDHPVAHQSESARHARPPGTLWAFTRWNDPSWFTTNNWRRRRDRYRYPHPCRLHSALRASYQATGYFCIADCGHGLAVDSSSRYLPTISWGRMLAPAYNYDLECRTGKLRHFLYRHAEVRRLVAPCVAGVGRWAVTFPATTNLKTYQFVA